MNQAISMVEIPTVSTIRIISTIKKKPLTPVETFHCTVKIMAGIVYPDDVLKAVVDTAVREAFTEAFAERLKKTPKLKNEIGGIKWSVDPLSIQFDRP